MSVLAVVKKENKKEGVWMVRPLTPTGEAFYTVRPEDFDYDDVAVNDLVDLQIGTPNKASRHGAKAQ